MPVDNSVAYVATERKSFKKPHWREKLFSKEKATRGTTDQQLEAFLGPSRPKPSTETIPSTDPNNLLRGVPTPRLDISSHRWPSSQDLSSPSPVSNPSSATDAYPPVSVSKPSLKPRHRKRLKVTFSEEAPKLIGEGGDEADAPTIEISMSRNRSHSSSSHESEYFPAQRGNTPILKLQVDTSVGNARGGQARDSSKGLNAEDWKPLLNNPQDVELLMSLSPAGSGSRLSFRASPESNSFAQRVRAKMQAEEGRALQNGYVEPPSPSNDAEPDSSDFVSVPTSPASSRGTSAAPGMDSVLRSTTSPVTRKHGNASPIDNLPQALLPAGPSRKLSPPQPTSNPDENGSGRHNRQPSQENRATSRSPQPPSQPASRPPKLSLRSIATQFGDAAFAEFKAFVTQYRSLFQIAAENVKPLMETSLVEWIRAAVWWFLRGKKTLESYARARPSSSGGSAQPRVSLQDAKQAVLDLGKAFWINEDIVPQHCELGKYGRMSLDALFAVASTTGDTKLTDVLGQHQAMMNYLRSLAMSIKRNNILSTVSADPDSADHLDTSLWVRYPFFAPDVSAVLSGASSRSMLVDKPSKAPSTVHMMPLGDTTRYFSYGSMFVEVCVSSREDDHSQAFAMPCALSIIRDRSDWYVFAAITGQSELVNIMIQSDRKQGPTWDDVSWHVSTHSMRVKLPRGFELDVTFEEDDFKMIWNIVQYTLKTQASLQPESGESPVFSTTLKAFQYMDPGPTKAFPAEPSERCKIRLFERSVTLTEGTGTRNAHRGFRLTVVTNPKVKSLSNVQHILGQGGPIVFGLLRGEADAPALMLKVTEDGRTRSMLMGFHDVEERTTMHSLLLGMVPGNTEFKKTSDLSIRSYAIEQPSDQAIGNPPMTHLQFAAGNVSVIDQEREYVSHGYGPTILSEHLRVFVASDFGSVTDRINLGMKLATSTGP